MTSVKINFELSQFVPPSLNAVNFNLSVHAPTLNGNDFAIISYTPPALNAVNFDFGGQGPSINSASLESSGRVKTTKFETLNSLSRIKKTNVGTIESLSRIKTLKFYNLQSDAYIETGYQPYINDITILSSAWIYKYIAPPSTGCDFCGSSYSTVDLSDFMKVRFCDNCGYRKYI